jgi:hypothetical protein
MKRFLPIAALLFAASACAPSNTTTNTANTNMGNVNMTASPAATAWTDTDITNQEKKIWDALKSKNYDAFASMLADDSIEVEDDGVYDKARSVETVKKLTVTDFNGANWKVFRLGDDAALLTYTASVKGTFDSKPIPEGDARASSAWVNRNGKWLAAFHQETRVKPSSATTPTPTASAAPSPSATIRPVSSPSAPPAATADAEANEKMVWDLIKKKDIDNFASLLADDVIDVAADGVDNKAQILDSIRKSQNLANASTSDYKSIKLGSNASLVTYRLKSGPPNKPVESYASTIWANRNGKWVAVFHQGTPVGAPAPASAKK